MECAQTAVMDNHRIAPQAHRGRDRTVTLHRSKFNSRESARACLLAVDECLNYLEERHLAGAYIARHSGCRKIVTALVRRLGISPPPSVEDARTSYALHCALLDWEGGILDSLIPNRHQQFPDLDLERDEWPVPRRRRRPRQSLGRQAQGRNALAGVA
jgi:hypothetical protein